MSTTKQPPRPRTAAGLIAGTATPADAPGRPPAAPAHATNNPAALTLRDLELGKGIVFVLGAWRTGTTLLRKVLDSHPKLSSPAETWFLLPLLDLWEGKGTHPQWNRAQAAAAIHSHLNIGEFVECCRAFAGRFYAQRFAPGTACLIDKTPFYLMLSRALPQIFPQARFIVLARDPRGTVWSRHTWKHIESKSPEGHFDEAAREMQELARFYQEHQASGRAHLVRYESLCEEPERACRTLCVFLGVPFDPAMLVYGDKPHHEGYGDEKSREHDKPHTASVARYEQEGLTQAQQRALIEKVGKETLARLGYDV